MGEGGDDPADLAEQAREHGSARRVGVVGAHHQPGLVHAIADGTRTAVAPLRGLGEDVVPVERGRGQGQLGELGEGEVHRRGPSRYFRLPWLTTSTLDWLRLSQSPNLRTAFVAVSE